MIKQVIVKRPGKNIDGLLFTEDDLISICRNLKNVTLFGENNPAIRQSYKVLTYNRVVMSLSDFQIVDNNLVAEMHLFDPILEYFINNNVEYSFALRGQANTLNHEVLPGTVNILAFDLVTNPKLKWK